jgi:hypothetical protein
MTKRGSSRDALDQISHFLAHNKGLLVFVGIGLVIANLVLTMVAAPGQAEGLWGWLSRSHLLLHLGVIVGLLGILIGDAL